MRLRPLVAPLLCLSLTSTIARADPPRVEAGVVTLDKWSNPAFEPMSSGGYGERVFDVDVPLRNAWNTPPLVVANLSMVDSDQSANLRLQIIVLSVGTNSFKLRFRTWADTKIWGAGASWFAIEAPPGTQPVPVLAPNPASAPDRVRVKSPGDDDSHLDRLPKRGPPPSCKRGTKFDCMPITSGVLFKKQVGTVKAVDGIDLDVYPSETLGLVGESGCGKSTAARTMMRLLKPTEGTVELGGRDITNLGRKDLVPLRREAQMIFQDPYNSLNPRHTVGTIISAPFKVQGVTPEGGVKAEVQSIMERVGLNPEHYNRYPNEFSGGQRQRIGIARAIALRPKLIMCDEPVSALDVSIQAQVINLLEDIQDEYGIAYVFVAHDLSVVRHISDRVAVMYLGRIVEIAPARELYLNPLHPYAEALLSAVPIPDPKVKRPRIKLEGDVPNPISPPKGCHFHTRCPIRQLPLCSEKTPELKQTSEGHWLACHLRG